MKSFTTALVASFAALVQAVKLTNSDFSVTAGQPFTITWSDATGPVTLTLKNGASTDLKTVAAITSGATGTSFTWTPSASLPSDTYAIEISDGTETNYSGQFPVVGASGSATASASGSASATASATASASASASASATATLTITSSASETASETAATASSAANSTIASTVSTSTRSTRVSSSTSGSTTAPTTVPGSDAGRIGSPIALIGLAVAAMLYIQ